MFGFLALASLLCAVHFTHKQQAATSAVTSPTFSALKQQIDEAMVRRNHAFSVTAGEPPASVNAAASSARQRTVTVPAVMTSVGLRLSPSAIEFENLLIGHTSSPVTETMMNSGPEPVTITAIDIIGPDGNDFSAAYSFALPVTLAPGSSLSINLNFTANSPWKPGTRNAKLKLKLKQDDENVVVPLTGVGATCGGALPACSSGCADSDGDGLNDAWEVAGGIDLNNDGKIDRRNDLLLPDADAMRPDIYVQYDWMDYGLNDVPCATDSDCTVDSRHATERCTGPATPYSAKSCVQSCIADTDCTALGPSHIGDRCIQSQCEHTHDPEALAPGALQAVVDVFAVHGFNLHIVRGHALPHSRVLSFRPPSAACEGADVPPGTLGAYAVNFYDLKQAGFDPAKAAAYHYSVFGHYGACDSPANCGACAATKGTTPSFGETGQAEISGNDFFVSLGNFFNDLAASPTIINLGGTFMHELGHNLGLHHAGGVTVPGTQCADTGTCQDSPNYKPNYLSVMNYRYQFSGILEGEALGSNAFRTCRSDADCSSQGHCRALGSIGICARLDFSNQTLPVGGNTPGALWEDGQLSEPAGLGSGTSDLFDFDDGQCAFQIAATEGPVNWDGIGLPDNLHATADLNSQDHDFLACLIHNQVLTGNTDWGPAPGQSIFLLPFQCSPNGLADGSPASAENLRDDGLITRAELTPEMAMRAHVLYPPAPVRIDITPGCDEKTIIPGRRGEFSIALLGSSSLDVRDVEPASLRFHGAGALRTEISDVNNDGRPDLMIAFDQATVRLDPRTRTGRLTGWLRSSQVFVGEDRVTVVP